VTEFLSPRLLRADDLLDDFDCGEESPNLWLRERATDNEALRASRTCVSMTSDARLAGYYTLSSFSLARGRTPSRLGRGQPDPIPAVLIGRLAVDTRFAGERLGRMLLLDALLRAHAAAEYVGIRAIVVHALHERAAGFYLRFGFRSLPGDPLTLYLLTEEVSALLA
jgi:GNAT superfamily N-acetyltransferase